MVGSLRYVTAKRFQVLYYYHNDHLGTPQKLTDSTGAIVWSADYKPFGEATITVSTITNNLRFPGQYYDAETGLNYNYFRDYNPVIGRYIEADPIGIKGGENHLYIYTANNPVRIKDPFGLFLCKMPYIAQYEIDIIWCGIDTKTCEENCREDYVVRKGDLKGYADCLKEHCNPDRCIKKANTDYENCVKAKCKNDFCKK